MRTYSALGTVLALTGCAGEPNPAPPERTDAAALIPCARDGAALAKACSMEVADGPDGRLVTVRRADGGFRRLIYGRKAGDIAAADGAERAIVTPFDTQSVDVAIGGDRYRLPVVPATP